jgi:putative ABC transport system permease protein
VLGYYLRMAVRSFRRAPGLTALMMSAIALGVAACIVTLTVYHGMSGNPLWRKNGELYAVTVNPLSSSQARQAGLPAYGSSQLDYDAASYLFDSDIPKRKALLAFQFGSISGAPRQTRPLPVMTQATTAGFFRMFHVPFRYGGPWSAAVDRGPEPVMVLSDRENHRLFGGTDSVGRTLLWSGNRFRIVGVLAPWHPLPRFYDLSAGNGGAFGRPAAAFIPFQWGPTLRDWPAGHMSCLSTSPSTYRALPGSGCTWIGMWVELPTHAARRHFLAFMQAYAANERAAGRFDAVNTHLWTISQWLRLHHLVSHRSGLLVYLAFALLAVCLINTLGILLAKFLRGAPAAGIRRALGASRRQIVAQHLVEAGALSLGGAALGLLLSAAGLAGVRLLYRGSEAAYGKFAHFDPIGVAWALVLALVSTLAAGLYPAWRIGRRPPATYLKSQ